MGRHWGPHVKAAKRFRPATEVLDATVSMRLAALARSALLLDAQAAGREAQRLLDAATERLPELGDAYAELNALTSSTGDEFFELVALRVIAGTTEGFLGADRLGRDVVRRIIGTSEAPSDGVGLGVLWASTYAQILFDYDRFCSLAATLYRLLQRPGAFDALATDDDWRSGHEDAHTKLADAGDTLQNMLAVAKHDRAAVRAILLYVQDIFEGACRHFAATILAHLGTGTYADHMANRQKRPLVHYLRDNATSHDLAVGLLGPLRNASGHNDYEIRDGFIVLGRGEAETILSDVAFADSALLFTESAIALSLTFEIALAQRGTPTSVIHSQSLLSPETALRLLIASAGLSDVEVHISPEVITVTGWGTLESPLPSVGALLLVLPEAASQLTLMWQVSERSRRLNVPLDLARAHARCEPDSIEQELASMELAHMTTLDGAPYLTLAGLRHSVALKAGAVVKATPQEFGIRFRLLRDLCTRVGDDDFAETLRLVMRAQRLIAMNEPADAQTAEAVDRLLGWEQQRVARPFPRIGTSRVPAFLGHGAACPWSILGCLSSRVGAGLFYSAHINAGRAVGRDVHDVPNRRLRADLAASAGSSLSLVASSICWSSDAPRTPGFSLSSGGRHDHHHDFDRRDVDRAAVHRGRADRFGWVSCRL